MFKPRENGYYDGFWQSEAYFKDIKDTIRKSFVFPEIDKNDKYNIDMANKIRSCKNPCFIHIRRGDYLELNWQLDVQYYKDAIKEILKRVENPTFFVVGQNCEDFINNELDIGVNFEYIGNHNTVIKKDYIDMQLMSMCRHAIITNSTFSRWSAWFIENKDKVIVAPFQWTLEDDSFANPIWVKA